MNLLTEWLNQYFDELTPKEFYRVIFPEGELDKKDAMTKGKYTGIIIEVTDKKKKQWEKDKSGRFILDEKGNRVPVMDKKTGKQREIPVIKRYTITDDLDIIDEVLESGNFCLTPPLSYAGKVRSSENARFLYAIAIDLDNIIEKNGKPVGLIDLWNGHIERAGRLPKPTMIVSSGTGLHLYYVFKKAIPLFPNIVKQMQKYKHELTSMCWNEGIVNIKSYDEVQYEGIYQGFRMPGTITKAGILDGTNERARCFLTGEKVDMDYMNGFVEDKFKVTEFTYKSNLTLEEAKNKYPDWYEKRIVEGYKGVMHPWHLSRNVYDWWKLQIESKSTVHHRYWCLWILAIYAKKCSFYDPKHNPNPVTREELEKDAWELMEHLEEMTDSEDNHFTETDVIEALEAFEDDFISYPKNSIRYKAAIPFEPAIKRREKPMKQADHIKMMNYVRDEIYHMDNWREGNGRPKGSKNKNNPREKLVKDYVKKHPDENVTDIARALQMSRTTVYKYLPKEKPEIELDYMISDEDGKKYLLETESKEKIQEQKEQLRKYLKNMIGEEI